MSSELQISKRTGISQDYINEWGWISTEIYLSKKRKNNLREALKKYSHIQPYRQHFQKYAHETDIGILFNERTNPIIAQLDLMAEEINRRIQTGIGFSPILVEAVIERVEELVYGEK